MQEADRKGQMYYGGGIFCGSWGHRAGAFKGSRGKDSSLPTLAIGLLAVRQLGSLCHPHVVLFAEKPQEAREMRGREGVLSSGESRGRCMQ